ncbi:MAG: hypothetical protein J5490_00905 [Bacteroidales bacterium]|nr:hypothetical protein [Bacteroidales bacterium]
MEQNKEMTASESLALITETLNNSRRAILRNNSKGFILWGSLLTVFSLAIYLLWHYTGNPAWNWLWFAFSAIGYPLATLVYKKDKNAPTNEIGKALGYIWATFGVFSLTISLIAILAVPMNLFLVIILLLGLAESISGVLLRNWPIIICGFLVGVGGAVVASTVHTSALTLLFTLGGVLLAATGLIVKQQYK